MTENGIHLGNDVLGVRIFFGEKGLQLTPTGSSAGMVEGAVRSIPGLVESGRNMLEIASAQSTRLLETLELALETHAPAPEAKMKSAEVAFEPLTIHLDACDSCGAPNNDVAFNLDALPIIHDKENKPARLFRPCCDHCGNAFGEILLYDDLKVDPKPTIYQVLNPIEHHSQKPVFVVDEQGRLSLDEPALLARYRFVEAMETSGDPRAEYQFDSGEYRIGKFTVALKFDCIPRAYRIWFKVKNNNLRADAVVRHIAGNQNIPIKQTGCNMEINFMDGTSLRYTENDPSTIFLIINHYPYTLTSFKQNTEKMVQHARTVIRAFETLPSSQKTQQNQAREAGSARGASIIDSKSPPVSTPEEKFKNFISFVYDKDGNMHMSVDEHAEKLDAFIRFLNSLLKTPGTDVRIANWIAEDYILEAKVQHRNNESLFIYFVFTNKNGDRFEYGISQALDKVTAMRMRSTRKINTHEMNKPAIKINKEGHLSVFQIYTRDELNPVRFRQKFQQILDNVAQFTQSIPNAQALLARMYERYGQETGLKQAVGRIEQLRALGFEADAVKLDTDLLKAVKSALKLEYEVELDRLKLSGATKSKLSSPFIFMRSGLHGVQAWSIRGDIRHLSTEASRILDFLKKHNGDILPSSADEANILVDRVLELKIRQLQAKLSGYISSRTEFHDHNSLSLELERLSEIRKNLKTMGIHVLIEEFYT